MVTDTDGPYQQAGNFAVGGHPEIFATGDPAVFFPFSPVIGSCNAIAPPLEFVADGDAIVSEMVLGPAYCGPPGSVHGGVIAMVFDELLGVTNLLQGTGGFTGTLTVVYRRPTPINQRVTMRAWPTAKEGRKGFIKGVMEHDGTLLAEAEGIFISANPDAPSAPRFV